MEKAEATIKKIKGELGNENVEVLPMVVVLDDFTQVTRRNRTNKISKFFESLLTYLARCEMLLVHSYLQTTKSTSFVNNAAVLENDFHLTKDGVESSFAVNYVSHFIFTTTLLPALSPNARIVNVTSFAQSFGTLTP